MGKPFQDTDLGLRVLNTLYQTLSVDSEWACVDRRSFQWWPYRQQQFIWADDAGVYDGLSVYRVCINTVLAEVTEDWGRVSRVLAIANRSASLFAYVPQEDAGIVRLTSIGYVHEQNYQWMSKLLTHAAGLQISCAYQDPLVTEIGREPTDTHPVSGTRDKPDELVRALGTAYRRAGVEPSKWKESGELSSIVEMLSASGLMTSGGPDGLTSYVPLQPKGETVPGDSVRHSALIEISTDEEHPHLGRGVLILLRMPRPVPVAAASLIADACNLFEDNKTTEMSLFGGWSASPPSNGMSTPTFVTFVPNLAAWPGLLTNLVLSQVNRARWIHERLNEAEEGFRRERAAEGGVDSEPPAAHEKVTNGSVHGIEETSEDVNLERRRIEDIPHDACLVALLDVVNESGRIRKSEAMKMTARQLGFSRAGANIRKTLSCIIATAVSRELIAADHEILMKKSESR